MDRKLLVVDDEEILCDLIASVMSSNGFEVATAYSGKQGVDKFNEFHPDMVLSDIRMPELSGIQLLEYVKKEKPETGVILFSGYSDSTEEEIMQKGAFAFIKKPFRVKEIVDCVNRFYSD